MCRSKSVERERKGKETDLQFIDTLLQQLQSILHMQAVQVYSVLIKFGIPENKQSAKLSNNKRRQ